MESDIGSANFTSVFSRATAGPPTSTSTSTAAMTSTARALAVAASAAALAPAPAAATTSIRTSSNTSNSTFVFIADTHLGEGCASAPTGYEPNDTDCYSVVDLRRTVARINALQPAPAFVVVGGDVTASAQETEFAAVKVLLDGLAMPYIPVMGNHDVWSYDQVVGDRTQTPAGDTLFARTFSPVFQRFVAANAAASASPLPPPSAASSSSRPHAPGTAGGDGSFTYPNASVYNPPHNCNSSFQSWELHAGGAAGDAVFGDDPNFDGLVFLAPDFNTRLKAPPPCPGSSPVGGCGVMGMAELFNFTGGSFPWTRERLRAMGAGGTTHTPTAASAGAGASGASAPPAATLALPATPGVRQVVLVVHQPLRCRPGVPDWYFCFSSDDKASLRSAFEDDLGGDVGLLWGVMAGHQHRWYNGSAFDESAFSSFIQWENSAVKGDALVHNMSSSFSVFEAAAGRVVGGVRHWFDSNGTGWVAERVAL